MFISHYYLHNLLQAYISDKTFYKSTDINLSIKDINIKLCLQIAKICTISRPGSLGNKDRDLVTDNIEISPWNADLSSVSKKKYKKPTWKFLMGTMPDLHRMIQHSEILLGEYRHCLLYINIGMFTIVFTVADSN